MLIKNNSDLITHGSVHALFLGRFHFIYNFLPNFYSKTFLATGLGFERVVEQLVNSKADIDMQNSNGNTAIFSGILIDI